MILRRVTINDAPALAKLYDLVWSRETSVLGEKLSRERRTNESTAAQWICGDAYFVVEAEGCIAAAVGCEARHGTLHLVHLATHPEHRKRGYANALMKQAEEYARETGAAKIWFDSAPGLDAADRLYLKLGYQKCGYLHQHYWGTDIILYEKLL